MKYFSTILISLLIVGFFAQLGAIGWNGTRLRQSEKDAAVHSVEIMLAQEDHRLEQLEGSDLYESLDRMQIQKRVQGFEKVPSEYALESGQVVFRKGDYLFLMVLREEAGICAVDTLTRPGCVCTRYDLWVWPASKGSIANVMYFASNAGFLIQVENGEHSGLEHPPTRQMNPLREIQRAGQERCPGVIALLQIRSARSNWPRWIRNLRKAP